MRNAKNRLRAFEAKLRSYENSLHDPKRVVVRIVEYGEDEIVSPLRTDCRTIDLTGESSLAIPPNMR